MSGLITANRNPLVTLWICFKCSSAELEFLEDVPSPDIVVVCRGGERLVSGLVAASETSR